MKAALRAARHSEGVCRARSARSGAKRSV